MIFVCDCFDSVVVFVCFDVVIDFFEVVVIVEVFCEVDYFVYCFCEY